ncbi:hypothetical protein [Sphingomonas lenta]|uniref:Terminase n=1 Tax=Sphingomonas lenta TaxID=1141887 RepID=A0A2A2SCU3_9SPHN|nr:hypothetical protein [Sphingomonas lenta]PAX07114.1 hypothetical protein CKY28_13800 [Sphingomonas lenta]
MRESNGRWTQVARAREKQWTPRLEARFLATLAACCNVKRACAEVGLSQASAYNHRTRWPDFAERWRTAVEHGYDRLSIEMAASAGRMLGDEELTADAVLEPISFDQALQALWLHKARVAGLGRAYQPARREVTIEEVRRRVMAVVELQERAMRAEAAAAERRARRRKPARADGG